MEEDLLEISDTGWDSVKHAARELDLVHGGYYRLRARSVVIYCSPDNAPEGWSLGFPDGSPELPRAAVGAAEVVGTAGGSHLLVRLRVSNWSAVRATREAYRRGEFSGRFQEYVLAQEEALRGRREDREWLARQFHRLHSHAVGLLVSDI